MKRETKQYILGGVTGSLFASLSTFYYKERYWVPWIVMITTGVSVGVVLGEVIF